MRILITDDHTLLRETVKDYIEASEPGATVLTADGLPEALRLADAGGFDLVLLDIDMPGMNGLAGLGEMKRRHPTMAVGIMSALATPENVVAAMDAGAAAFIPKTMGAAAMLVALRLVLAGERYVPAGALKKLHEQGARAAVARPSSISSDDARILELLKQGKTNKEIGRALGIEEYTVKYHVRGIFRKLGAKNRTEAVRIAIEQNLPAKGIR
jgi:DNA-binding NarL/FixJ family response regulator